MATEDKVSKIFDEIEAAQNVDDVNRALKAAEGLDETAQAGFLKRLRTEFSKKARSEGAFSVVCIEPLDRNDFSHGFRIVFKQPKS